ncbi:MAG TPA: hypothetical protein VD969_03620 [Symbiobacteriaceae bacterium]|nr:hypothetical protein [Symbiobacteriaceae bacterium]
MSKRWMLTLMLVAVLAAVAVPAASAGVLTSSGYTYVLRGRELELPVDILTVQGAVLVPEELLAALELRPAVDGDAIRLERGPVTVELGLGSDVARIDGKARLLKAAPLLASGRLFVPAEVLADLGLSLIVDGKFVLLTRYDAASGDAGHVDLKAHSLTTAARDGGSPYDLEVVALTPELLADPSLSIPWGTQLKLRALVETRTLLLVTLHNPAPRAVTLDPARLMLVDEAGRQYDYQKQEFPVTGSVTGAVAPGARRTSVLAFARVEGAEFDLYHDAAQNMLGRLPAR